MDIPSTIALVSNLIVPAIAGYCVWVAKDNRISKKKAESTRLLHIEALMSGIKLQLRIFCRDNIDQGYLNDIDRECITSLFNTYKDLGGNGLVEKYVEETLTLPPEGKRK